MMQRINPEMLVLAREARGLLQEDLAALVSVTQGTISKIEGGFFDPSRELISSLAKSLRVSPAFLYRTDRVYGFNSTVYFHRKRAHGTEKPLRRLHARMNIFRMRISVLLRSAQITPPRRIQPVDPGEYRHKCDVVAGLVRSHWLIPMGPVRSVTSTMEDAGVIVYKTPFGTSKIDAISEWAPGYPPIVFLNSEADIPPSRVRFTLAHELGHLIMHQSFMPEGDVERQANDFAGEFLMPRKEIKPFLYGLNLAKLVDLKQRWKVSLTALISHSRRLETIDEEQYRNLNINVRRKWGIHEPCEEAMPIETPALLSELLSAHTSELGYSREELAEMLWYSDLPDFDEELSSVRKMRLVG